MLGLLIMRMRWLISGVILLWAIPVWAQFKGPDQRPGRCSRDISASCSQVNNVNGVAYPASPPVNTIPQVTSTGQVSYLPANRPAVALNQNLTGTDTVSINAGNAKYTLTANETLTIQSGTITPTATATLPFTWNFRVCQNVTGNFTLTFAAGTGVSNICWSGGGACGATTGQPGYTLTASNGDDYTAIYDGTNVRIREVLSNVPC